MDYRVNWESKDEIKLLEEFSKRLKDIRENSLDEVNKVFNELSAIEFDIRDMRLKDRVDKIFNEAEDLKLSLKVKEDFKAKDLSKEVDLAFNECDNELDRDIFEAINNSKELLKELEKTVKW